MNLREKILRSEVMSTPQKVRVLAALNHLSEERRIELEAAMNLEQKFEEKMFLMLETELKKGEADARHYFESQSN